jgi:hypothetical protein
VEDEKQPWAHAGLSDAKTARTVYNAASMKVLIHRSGQQFGPYTLDQARAYLAAGNLVESDLAWYDGAKNWVPLGQITNLEPEVFEKKPDAPSWVPQRRDAQSASRLPVSSAPWGMPQGTAPRLTPVPVHAATTSDAAFAANTKRESADDPVPVANASSAPASDDPDDLPRAKPKNTRNATNPFTRQQRSSAVTNILFGGIIGIAGGAAMYFSYEYTKSSSSIVIFIIALGTIVFGAIRLLTGVIQFFKA